MSGSIPVVEPAGPSPATVGTAIMRRRWKKLHPATRYGLLFSGLMALAVVIQFVIHALRSEPRDMRAIAERELLVNTLAPGERVIRQVSVFRRPAIDYFRATRGLLVLTDRRLIFLGLRPRDFLASIQAPPTFDQRDFPLDTLVKVNGGRAMLWLTHGIIVHTPDESIKLAIPSAAWPAARLLVARFEERDKQLRAEGLRQEKLRAQAEAEWKAALAERRKPRYYTVDRGDALGSIATRWNTTPERLMQWNKKSDNRIRVGEVLLVRPGDG
jgi:uncharacterized protein (UPF0548 family)